MQRLYRLEVFHRDYSFMDFCPIEPLPLLCDYLTLERTTITTQAIAADKGCYVVISDSLGRSVYQGVIDDLETTGSTSRITLKPLLSLFDTKVYFDRTTLSTAEAFIGSAITSHFATSGDPLQNIAGLTVEEVTETPAKFNLKDNVHPLYEIITKALTLYGVVVTATLYPQQKRLHLSIARHSLLPAVIEADLDHLLEKNFVIGDSYGQLNKLTIINKQNETQKRDYYLHLDGTVSAINTSRITPVFFEVEYYEGEDFDNEAYTRAYEVLAPQSYNNLIELVCHNDSMIIDASMPIGSIADIYTGGRGYRSLLTGKELLPSTTRLVFGTVRADLTKQLIIERRKSR